MINGLWERYERGELPAIYCSNNPIANAFCDALKIQADRILNNLQKHFPDMTKEEISNACFCGKEE